MTPLLASAIFAAPALFPGHDPLAVWIGLTSVAVLGGLWWRADQFGGCETTLRAMEARDCLERMNDRRVRLPKTNKSGVKGVNWHKSMRKWRAVITVARKNILLGYFANLEDAAARIAAARPQYHGEFGRLK